MGVPKEKPPPAVALFPGAPKLKAAVGLVALWVWADEPKVKPPPVAAGVEVVSPKPVAVAVGAEAVVFGVPKVKPEEGCPKVNPPLIFSRRISFSFTTTFQTLATNKVNYTLLNVTLMVTRIKKKLTTHPALKTWLAA